MVACLFTSEIASKGNFLKSFVHDSKQVLRKSLIIHTRRTLTKATEGLPKIRLFEDIL